MSQFQKGLCPAEQYEILLIHLSAQNLENISKQLPGSVKILSINNFRSMMYRKSTLSKTDVVRSVKELPADRVYILAFVK